MLALHPGVHVALAPRLVNQLYLLPVGGLSSSLSTLHSNRFGMFVPHCTTSPSDTPPKFAVEFMKMPLWYMYISAR